MDQPDPIATPAIAEADMLRLRIEKLEQESQETRQLANERLVLAELKVEAVRAGIMDLDGLRFLDITRAHLDNDGNVPDARELVDQLKRKKPWLFAMPLSSSPARVPPSGPARQKLATEMSEEEYRIARAEMLRNSSI